MVHVVVVVVAAKVEVVGTGIRKGFSSTFLIGFKLNLTKGFHKETLLQCCPVKVTRNSSLFLILIVVWALWKA